MGYVGQSVAMSECADIGPNPKAIFLSATYGPIGRMARDSDALFVSALERALASHDGKTWRNSHELLGVEFGGGFDGTGLQANIKLEAK